MVQNRLPRARRHDKGVVGLQGVLWGKLRDKIQCMSARKG
jgi:hypothetical protein